MKTIEFTQETGISDDYAAYLANEAEALSKLDVFEIDNYADRELYNPDMQAFLGGMPQEGNILPGANEMTLTLSFAESRSQAVALFGARFRRLKNKIREVLCKVANDLLGDGDLNWKDIIKAVVIALIPALGGGPLSVVVLPIVISLVAKLMKRGLEAVCPVAA